MAIHYENYRRFSKGQGFIGSLCRPISAQATTKRFHASDCIACKQRIVGRKVISRAGVIGTVLGFEGARVQILIQMEAEPIEITSGTLDQSWAPLDIEEIFRD